MFRCCLRLLQPLVVRVPILLDCIRCFRQLIMHSTEWRRPTSTLLVLSPFQAQHRLWLKIFFFCFWYCLTFTAELLIFFCKEFALCHWVLVWWKFSWWRRNLRDWYNWCETRFTSSNFCTKSNWWQSWRHIPWFLTRLSFVGESINYVSS